jgi:RimJ/RimL family protein N-acetyltransferase
MGVALTKSTIRQDLPLRQAPWTIREWRRQDLELLGAWPDYPFPYEGFAFSFKAMASAERDRLFQDRQERPNALVLVADHAYEPAIAYISLLRIAWTERGIGNLGMRVHPAWCDRGAGTALLRLVTRYLFQCDFESVRVDVAASNPRAIRCYQKVGFRSVGELWREARDLQDVDIGAWRYDFLRPHLRWEGEVPQLRFLLMELVSREWKVGSG